MATSPATVRVREPVRRPLVQRPLAAGLILLALYVAVIALGDHRTYSGSDAGGRLASVVAMGEESTLAPDVGYWAEDGDPAGIHHPLWNTTAIGDSWVQATSVPFVAAAIPLWAAAGPTGVLLVPVLAGVAAAFGARRLARQLGAGDGWAAFWIVGAASPVLFYAGDFWEHVPAVALGVWALSIALDAERPSQALLAGLLAGAAAVLRAEMVLYATAFGALTLAIPDERRRWSRRPLMVLGAVGGVAAPLAANALLERALLGGGVRDSRAGGAVGGVAQEAGQRLQDAILTGSSPFPETSPFGLVTALALLSAVLVVAWWATRRPDHRGPALRIALALLGAIYLARFADGLGFVPGLLAAVPLAAIGILGASTPRQRLVAGTALAAVPLVWTLQWSGNHIAQWGGRYLLTSGVLLVVVACAALTRVGWRQPAALALLGLTVGTAVFGAAWHVERTRAIGHAVDAVEQAPADVVIISTQPHLGREGGRWYGNHRWLSVDDPDTLDDAVELAADMGVERFDLVDLVHDGQIEAREFDGFRLVDTSSVSWPGGQLLIRSFAGA